jgi:hypothetical protein
MIKGVYLGVNDGKNLTNGNGFGNFVGISWEKLFFSWEKLGTFRIDCEGVTKINGNFVGITFFFVGITWEKLKLFCNSICFKLK